MLWIQTSTLLGLACWSSSFQLHVMDSLPVALSSGLGRALRSFNSMLWILPSTPCRSLSCCYPFNSMLWIHSDVSIVGYLVSELDAFNSMLWIHVEVVKLLERIPIFPFQLHVMDSVHQSCRIQGLGFQNLSTPCYGFVDFTL